MKTLGKSLANKIATVIVALALLVAGLFAVKHFFPNIFGGTTKAQYHFVLKKFTKENELVVAGAEVDTLRQQTFTNNEIKNWPDWSEPITNFFVSRKLTVKVPVSTEFKLELKNISKNDVLIKDNVLTFKKPLIVKVDSQQNGKIKADNSNGVVDKVVDAATSGTAAQEFLDDKTQETIRKTSDFVMNDASRQEKVRKYAEQDLEQLLNLKEGEKLTVKLNLDDLKFKNIDK